MNQALNNRETRFQKLILSLNDFQKSRINAHEMYFNGKMYDVKSFKITSDKVELLVINDTKEENILANIKKSADTGTEQNKKLSFRQFNLLNWFYIYPDSGNKFILQKQKINYPSFAENALSVINEISTPPPESV